MIKLIAEATMLIDHVGYILFPDVLWLRIVGRLSMPLYAYCVARGYHHSSRHGTQLRYTLRIALLAFVSQLPYFWMTGSSCWNICQTWVDAIVAMCCLTVLSHSKRVLHKVLGGIAVLVFLLCVSRFVEYGLYGIVTVLLFYWLIVSQRESVANYLIVLMIGVLGFVLFQNGSQLQLAAVPAAIVLTVSKRFDDKVKLPRWAFYLFYPAHILVLLGIRYLLV